MTGGDARLRRDFAEAGAVPALRFVLDDRDLVTRWGARFAGARLVEVASSEDSASSDRTAGWLFLIAAGVDLRAALADAAGAVLADDALAAIVGGDRPTLGLLFDVIPGFDLLLWERGVVEVLPLEAEASGIDGWAPLVEPA